MYESHYCDSNTRTHAQIHINQTSVHSFLIHNLFKLDTLYRKQILLLFLSAVLQPVSFKRWQLFTVRKVTKLLLPSACREQLKRATLPNFRVLHKFPIKVTALWDNVLIGLTDSIAALQTCWSLTDWCWKSDDATILANCVLWVFNWLLIFQTVWRERSFSVCVGGEVQNSISTSTLNGSIYHGEN